MKPSNLLSIGCKSLLPAVAALLAFVVVRPAVAQSDPYTWSAQLVAVDEQAGTITVDARLVTEADVEAIAALGSGTRATLVWSGMNWAAGVRRVMRGAPAADETLTLPIELVSLEDENRYVRFRVPVPRSDLPKIRSLVAGGWVTATSPRRPASGAEAVASVRPYNDVG